MSITFSNQDAMEETAKKTPQISIGMPVYNGEQFIREALDSLLAQTFTDLELIISDNASTDGTEAICREYEAKDKRIRYVRWAENRGAQANFNFVLDEAVGEYFMWAACDDIRSVNYIATNLNYLESNIDYVSSTSPVRFKNDNFDIKRMGDETLSGDVASRVKGFFGTWHANGRFYSLFRTCIIKNNPYLKREFFGSDWAFMVNVILLGKTRRLEEGWTELGKEGFSNSGKIISHYRTSWVHWFIPFYELSAEVNKMIKKFPYKIIFCVNMQLLKLNMQAILVSLAIYFKSKLKRMI